MKTYFSKVVFTDESRVTLDGPDGWSKGWVLQDRKAPVSKRRQQGRGSIMIWAGIYGDKLFGTYKVNDEVKLTSQSYCQFLDKIFQQLLLNQDQDLLYQAMSLNCQYMHCTTVVHEKHLPRYSVLVLYNCCSTLVESQLLST